jgi:hypothetical protein
MKLASLVEVEIEKIIIKLYFKAGKQEESHAPEI